MPAVSFQHSAFFAEAEAESNAPGSELTSRRICLFAAQLQLEFFFEEPLDASSGQDQARS